MSLPPQEAVGCSETSNEESIETTVVRSLGCIVRDEGKPYSIITYLKTKRRSSRK